MRKVFMIIVIIMLLAFVPLIAQETVKEEVKVVNVEVPVRAPEIRIKELRFKNQKLIIAIENICLKKTGKGTEGRIGIYIRIPDHFNILPVKMSEERFTGLKIIRIAGMNYYF